MAYIATSCINEKYKSGEEYKDTQGNRRICCRLDNNLCIAQRWCTKQKKYIISERAKDICKNYK